LPASLEVGPARPLFDLRFPGYDVTADGQRFLVVARAARKAWAPISVVINWASGLKR